MVIENFGSLHVNMNTFGIFKTMQRNAIQINRGCVHIMLIQSSDKCLLICCDEI